MVQPTVPVPPPIPNRGHQQEDGSVIQRGCIEAGQEASPKQAVATRLASRRRVH